MNWGAMDLNNEWTRFRQHCDFAFKGPLASKTEVEKVNYFMTFIGDKDIDVYTTFTWKAATGSAPAENETLKGVYDKYAAYVKPKTNEIRATVAFQRRKLGPEESFDNFVTDLKIHAKDCGFTDETRQLRDAGAVRSHHAQILEKCLKEGDKLTLDKAISIVQNYETSQESMKA